MKKRKLATDVLLFNIIGYIVIILFAAVCVLPLFLIVINSFASNSLIMVNGYSFWPKEFSLEAYKMIFEVPADMLNAYKVTIIVTIMGTFFSLLVCSTAGYVLSRTDFKYRNIISFYFFFTTIFSAGLVPTYTMCIQYLGFKERPYLALILPGVFSYFYVIIFRSFMSDIPSSLGESAKIDGANDIQIFIKIILPLCKPVMATVGLFAALACWGDWYNALLYVTDRSYYPLQYYLYTIINRAKAISDVAAEMSLPMDMLPTETFKLGMTVVATGPIVLVYPFVQKYFIKGMTVGAVKG